MNKALKTDVAHRRGHSGPLAGSPDWRSRMSNNVAYALLTYTALQIFVTVHALKEGASGMMPFLILVILVAGIIPACRWFERRWQNLDDHQTHDPALAPAFRKDQVGLWLMAIGVPLTITGLCKLISTMG
ncbi:MAG: hypothetical protein ACK5NN_03835 [Sphingomonadaceae bacterium]